MDKTEKVIQIQGVGIILFILTDKGNIFACTDQAVGRWESVPLPDKIKTIKRDLP